VNNTATPSWLRSVPRNFGDASTSTFKADEWHVMFTVYLPLALVSIWGDGMSHESLWTMTQAHTLAYHNYVATWLGNLMKIHLEACPWPNCHMALHIYDFLLLFGPVRSSWCFPFECLIGQLQQLLSNHKLGMMDCVLGYMLLMTLQERWKAH